jgi:hypothetical protein
VVVDVRALAGGMSGALSVVGSGTIATSPTVWKHYGRSVAFNGVNTSVQLNGIPPKCLQADWTIECWVFANILTSSPSVFGVVDMSGNVLLKATLNGNNTASVHARDASGLLVRITSASSTIGVGTWVHLAVVAYNGTLTLLVSGVSVRQTAWVLFSIWPNCSGSFFHSPRIEGRVILGFASWFFNSNWWFL